MILLPLLKRSRERRQCSNDGYSPDYYVRYIDLDITPLYSAFILKFSYCSIVMMEHHLVICSLSRRGLHSIDSLSEA